LRHDSEGELGDNLVFFTAEAQMAPVIAEALAAEGAPASARGRGDWHSYATWEQILEKKSPYTTGYPWSYEHGSLAHRRYSREMCPLTLDLLDRAVHVVVAPHWTEGDCEQIAGAMNKVFGAYFGEATEFGGW
jgi:hypothetical protein